jgi:crossover junction endodeoxyribonuclease RusA
MTLAFTVYGCAESKGNHKAYQGKGMHFPIITESNRKVASWQQLVAEAASHALQQRPLEQRALLWATQGVRVSIAFYLPRPKKYHKRGVFVPHCTRPDCDRLTRAVLDALTHVVIHDDKQVTELLAGKYYTEVDGPARVDVRVEPAPGQPMRVPAASLPLFAEANQ